MIRKVPNKKYWILKKKDARILFKVNRIWPFGTFRLPLFSLINYVDDYKCIDPDDIILVAQDFILDVNEEELHLINEIWNKFYED